MSDRMRQIPFGQLMTWALGEYETEGTVFGVRKLYDREHTGSFSIFGEKLELPLGPAAGPHTQLAQNLVAAYVAGARFFELKTVQVLDGEDLTVSKPCINAQDEGYNVEWSTELYVPQALDEYIKGWFAIKLLSRELGLGSDDGFVFNMSVGYDLEGIRTKKIDSFIEGLKNAEHTDYWKTCKSWVDDNLSRFKYVDKYMIDSIEPNISSSITLSTLHGCPPEEIERIAEYLLKEKGLHTFIKCNPTLLGYDYARETLDKLGFDYISFDDKHFRNDLQFEDAVPMLRRLQKLADSLSLEFGVKLTNTFPVKIEKNRCYFPDSTGELSGEEMYMSGRALFPLSLEVANRLSKAMDGKLKISYSGGADARNIADIYRAGIWPITVATTLLKPGGYERLYQMASNLHDAYMQEECMPNGMEREFDAKAPDKYSAVRLDRLQELVDNAMRSKTYSKPTGMLPNRKIEAKLPLLDCFEAPCQHGCPFGQDVPAYLRLAGEGKYLDALRVITERNPLPHITGTICSHNCMDKCSRFYYEKSIDIRAVKLEAAERAYDLLLSEIKSSASTATEGKKAGARTPGRPPVAIIGGGPAGLAAAYFLARAGCQVTLFEQRSSLGGVVRHAIPEFRIGHDAIDKDVALVIAMGVDVRMNAKVTSLDMLRSEGFEDIIIATGAWEPSVLRLKEGSAIDALAFLEKLKNSPNGQPFGDNIVVIGGGNTAMDTARAAKRMSGVRNVTLAYRRTKRYMPAAPEEIELALADGVEFVELAAPISLKDGVLTCSLMELGELDQSGRRSPVATGETIEIPCDLLVSAIGNKVDSSLFDGQGVGEGVYIIGDAARGPATVAEAIADAAKCAMEIANASFDKYLERNISDDVGRAQGKKGVICCDVSEMHEPERCLECPTMCSLCVDVCPNRANINLSVDGRPQVVHIDFMCNECGNCAVFCPYAEGMPYRDKFTYFIYEVDFDNSKNPGFIALEDGSIRVRLEGKVSDHRDGVNLPIDIWMLIEESIKVFSRWFV